VITAKVAATVRRYHHRYEGFECHRQKGTLRPLQEMSWDEGALFIDFGERTCLLPEDGSESDSRGALDGGNPPKAYET
jgi:hypothetical protein